MNKIVLIGEGGFFPDSLQYFLDRSFEITVIKTKNNFIWGDNYELFSKMGMKIVENTTKNLDSIKKYLDEKTLVISGPTFMNCQKEYHVASILKTGLEELDILYELSKYNNEHNKGAVCVRFFNGETGFGDKKTLDMFAKKTKYIDVLLFDNDQLRDFVLTNIPSLNNKKIFLGWFETPLKKFFHHNQNKIERKICSLGRILCSYPQHKLNWNDLAVKFFPVKKIKFFDKLRGRKKLYRLAGMMKDTDSLYKDRELFYKWESECAFGLSHMYDVFSNSIEDFHKYKDFYFSLFGQTMPHNVCSWQETYYQFCNNANKDVCYLMNGIIPLISHVEHDVYKKMVDKKMAILIKTPEDFYKVLKMSDEEIQEYRDNIYANRDLFSFDHVGQILIDLLDDNSVNKLTKHKKR